MTKPRVSVGSCSFLPPVSAYLVSLLYSSHNSSSESSYMANETIEEAYFKDVMKDADELDALVSANNKREALQLMLVPSTVPTSDQRIYHPCQKATLHYDDIESINQ